jgi:hypothetical protein
MVEIGVNRTVRINCLVGKFQVATLNGHHQKRSISTINLPVVHMEWDVMILILIFHYKSHWKGWSLKIETFLGPEMATSESSAIWAQKKSIYTDK